MHVLGTARGQRAIGEHGSRERTSPLGDAHLQLPREHDVKLVGVVARLHEHAVGVGELVAELRRELLDVRRLERLDDADERDGISMWASDGVDEGHRWQFS